MHSTEIWKNTLSFLLSSLLLFSLFKNFYLLASTHTLIIMNADTEPFEEDGDVHVPDSFFMEKSNKRIPIYGESVDNLHFLSVVELIVRGEFINYFRIKECLAAVFDKASANVRKRINGFEFDQTCCEDFCVRFHLNIKIATPFSEGIKLSKQDWPWLQMQTVDLSNQKPSCEECSGTVTEVAVVEAEPGLLKSTSIRHVNNERRCNLASSEAKNELTISAKPHDERHISQKSPRKIILQFQNNSSASADPLVIDKATFMNIHGEGIAKYQKCQPSFHVVHLYSFSKTGCGESACVKYAAIPFSCLIKLDGFTNHSIISVPQNKDSCFSSVRACMFAIGIDLAEGAVKWDNLAIRQDSAGFIRENPLFEHMGTTLLEMFKNSCPDVRYLWEQIMGGNICIRTNTDTTSDAYNVVLEEFYKWCDGTALPGTTVLDWFLIGVAFTLEIDVTCISVVNGGGSEFSSEQNYNYSTSLSADDNSVIPKVTVLQYNEIFYAVVNNNEFCNK